LRGQVGYTGTGTDGAIESYNSGLVLNGYNVIILYSGEFYRPSASATLPYTTTATLPDVDSNLVSIGDANLRQDLASDASGSGASLVSMEGGPTVEVAVLDRVTRVTSIAAMEAYSAPVGYVFSLNAGGRSGTFDVVAGDFSAELAADTENGIYIGMADDPTALTKIAKRRFNKGASILWFGAVGDGVTDEAASIQAALLARKHIFIPDGVFLINGPYNSAAGMEMQDGQVVEFESKDAVLLQGTIRFMLTAGTGDGGTTSVDDNKKNIHIFGGTLQNNAGTFLEQKHLCLLSAVSNVHIHDMNFIGFQGDGIYLGSGTSGLVERHNENITIENNVFDGVNNENRLAVTIIDCDGLVVRNNKFIRSSRTGMPGVIDFEPNAGDTFAIGMNFTIENNSFESCAGGSAFVYTTKSVGAALTTPPLAIKVKNNVVSADCSFTGAIFRMSSLQSISNASLPMEIKITGNVTLCNQVPVSLQNIRGAIVDKNTFIDSSVFVIGDAAITSETFRDVVVRCNVFKNCGNSTGIIAVASGVRLSILNNVFDKPKSSPYGITFQGIDVTTTSSFVFIRENTFVKGSVQTHTIYTFNHTLDRESNKFTGNMYVDDMDEMITLLNEFDWPGNPVAVTAFLNSYTAASPVFYWKTEDGNVHLEGAVTGGLSTAIFTVPDGYRPLSNALIAVSSNDAFGQVACFTNGSIAARIGSMDAVNLHGITYRAR
jgi:hypothetical protein